ncbi:TolC family outer membrane protein [Hydrogenophaga sp. OTU3427]|uniref:TolC family outer membrane protein n=1 Tax=Hydrogenophaga sp. OTU3427 TaxID=3043856 RepID=UPI00313A90A6
MNRHILARAAVAAICGVLLTGGVATAQNLPEPMREAARKAVNSHPSVQAKWHALLGTTARQEAERGPMLPQVDLHASVGREWQERPGSSTGGYTHTNGTLSLNQMLYDGGAAGGAVRQAGFERLSRYYGLLDSAEAIALAAVLAYADLARATELVELAKRNYVEHKLVNQQLTERESGGVSRRADVEQSLGRLALAESNLAEELAGHQRAAQAYLHAVGELPPANVPELAASVGLPVPAGNVPEALSQALRQSPRLWMAVENVRASRAAVDVYRSANRPRLDLRASQSLDRNLDGVRGRSRDAVIELLLRFNLYRGGGYEARVVQAAEAMNQALDNQEATCRDLRQTLAITLNEVNTQREQTQLLDTQRLATEKVQAAYQQQFNIGQRTLLDLLDTQNEAFEASRAYTRARYALFAAQAKVLASTGRLGPALGITREGMPSASDMGQDQPEIDPGSLCSPESVALVAVDKTPPPRPVPLPRSYVVLLQNADGTTGKVVVAGDKGTIELGQPRDASALDGSRQPYAVPDDMLARDTGRAIDGSPIAPQVFLLNFEKGSTKLTPQSQAMMDRVFGSVRERTSTDVSIVGHTDTLGSAASNQSLSLRRAESVSRMLKPVASRIVAMDIGGMGETSPVVPTADNVSEPRNRRVELTVR